MKLYFSFADYSECGPVPVSGSIWKGKSAGRVIGGKDVEKAVPWQVAVAKFTQSGTLKDVSHLASK